MSNADFQDRLQRIGAKPASRQPVKPRSGRMRYAQRQKPNAFSVGLGGAAIGGGSYMLGYVNQHYDAIRESGAFGTLVGFGLGGLVFYLVGIIILIRVAYKAYFAPSSPRVVDEEKGRPAPTQRRARRPVILRIGIGGAVLGAGSYMLGYVNQHYDAIRESGAFGTLVGFGLGGLVFYLVGIIMMIRAFSKRNMMPTDTGDFQDEIDKAKPARQAPGWLRVLFTLLGLAFGTIACLYMFMFSAAWQIGTETAQTFAHGAVLIALCLIALSLLFGLVGIFLSGFALGRVPVYFLFGGIVTYLAVPMLGINMLEWQEFVALLQ